MKYTKDRIAYDAKQRYRKGVNYFDETLSKAVLEIDGTLLRGEKHAYIIINYNIEDGNTLEIEYTRIIMKLRSIFERSILPSSDRWYVETQNLELVYVPVILGIYSPAVYSIPFYKLLDEDEARISKTMFPCEIESILTEEMNASDALVIWVDAIKKLGEMKLHIQRYQQIMEVTVDEKCYYVQTGFVESLINQIDSLWRECRFAEEFINEQISEADGQNKDLLSSIKQFFDCHEEIISVIRTQKDTTVLLQTIENVLILMFVLQPYVSTCVFSIN